MIINEQSDGSRRPGIHLTTYCRGGGANVLKGEPETHRKTEPSHTCVPGPLGVRIGGDQMSGPPAYKRGVRPGIVPPQDGEGCGGGSG